MTIVCPAKAILLGEWAILNGARGLGIAVPETAFRATQKKSLTPRPSQIRFESDDAEVFEYEINQPWQSAPLFWQTTARVIDALARGNLGPEKVDHLLGSTIEFKRSWPVNHGLGSSGCLLLTLAALAYGSQVTIAELKGRFESLRRLGSDVFGSSGFDVALSLWGGIVEYDQQTPQTSMVPLPKNLYLVHTLSKMSTEKAVRNVTGHQLRNLQQKICDSLRTFWDSRDWALAFSEHLSALASAGLVPSAIEKNLSLWRHRGWIEAGKTMGAGGGDGLWLLVNPLYKDEFMSEMKTAGFFVRPIGSQLLAQGLKIL